MSLKEYITNLINKSSPNKEVDKKLGNKVVCPEYSSNKIDVKSFPSDTKSNIFILLWNIENGGKFSATIKPYSHEFVYRRNFSFNTLTQLHTHDYIELAYIVEGQFKQRIMGQEILFKKGELCLIDKSCPHQDFLENEDSIILFIGLANEIFDEVMVKNIGEEKILHFLQTALMYKKSINQYLHFKPRNQSSNVIEEYLINLVKELEKNDIASSYICKGLIMRIMHYISTEYDFNLSKEEKRKMKWLVFKEVTKYIDENYIDITVKDLVTKFHFNEDYFNRLFKEKSSMTYLEYLQEIRLKNAYDLIQNTNNSIEEIASKVGYNNKGYFYKIFVAKYKMTPAKLRKKLI